MPERSKGDQALGFYEVGDEEPRAAGTRSARLLPERVLGWSEDGGDAFVLGSYAGIRGVYLVPARGARGELLPQLVVETPAAEVGMAQAPGDIAIFSAGGMFLVYQDGSLSSLDMPDETPRPVGPMPWLPSLPYSGV